MQSKSNKYLVKEPTPSNARKWSIYSLDCSDLVVTAAGVHRVGNDQVRAMVGSVSQRHHVAAQRVLRLRLRARRVSHAT